MELVDLLVTKLVGWLVCWMELVDFLVSYKVSWLDCLLVS